MRPPNNKCLCYYVGDHDTKSEDEGSNPRCAVCVQRTLQPHLDRHAQAIADRDQARDDCARQLDALPDHNRLAAAEAESQRLRDRLMALRKQCAERAVRVASQAVENDWHREATQLALSAGGIEEPQQQLQRLEQSLLQGSLHHALDVASQQVRVLRFQWARKALAMHRLDIDPNDVKLTTLQQRETSKSPIRGQLSTPRRARGIGKIGGLPLPHAGPELYGVLPPKELQSALRLVASVTCTVARCLGIVLPHPILLTPTTGGSTMGDITDTVSDHELQRRLRESHHATSLVDDGTHQSPGPRTMPSTSRSIPHDTPHQAPSSVSGSIMSLVDTSYWKRSAKKALARATGHTTSSSSPSSFSVPSTMTSNSSSSSASSSSFVPPSMDSSQLSLRIHHATAAVLAEDSNPSSSKFALSAEVMHQDDFAIALQLLQNNVIVLCIRAGVPVSKLWPAEAVLLNLYQLDQYCQEQTAVSY
jgi:hypothetical protein